MSKPSTSGQWSILSYSKAATLENLMVESQVNGKKVLIPFSEIVSAISSATGGVPLPTEEGTYIMNVTVSEECVSYSWEPANPLEYGE